jgi:hypothetical protein
MTQNKYARIRTELATLQNMCEGDNELFLDNVSVMLGMKDEQIEKLKKQISDDSWIINPDRMGGGGWTAEELDPNRGWK